VTVNEEDWCIIDYDEGSSIIYKASTKAFRRAERSSVVSSKIMMIT
jgi:hypothetical protein